MRDNTDFWCCDKLLDEAKYFGFTIREITEMSGYKYCQYCGRKLSTV